MKIKNTIQFNVTILFISGWIITACSGEKINSVSPAFKPVGVASIERIDTIELVAWLQACGDCECETDEALTGRTLLINGSTLTKGLVTNISGDKPDIGMIDLTKLHHYKYIASWIEQQGTSAAPSDIRLPFYTLVDNNCASLSTSMPLLEDIYSLDHPSFDIGYYSGENAFAAISVNNIILRQPGLAIRPIHARTNIAGSTIMLDRGHSVKLPKLACYSDRFCVSYISDNNVVRAAIFDNHLHLLHQMDVATGADRYFSVAIVPDPIIEAYLIIYADQRYFLSGKLLFADGSLSDEFALTDRFDPVWYQPREYHLAAMAQDGRPVYKIIYPSSEEIVGTDPMIDLQLMTISREADSTLTIDRPSKIAPDEDQVSVEYSYIFPSTNYFTMLCCEASLSTEGAVTFLDPETFEIKRFQIP